MLEPVGAEDNFQKKILANWRKEIRTQKKKEKEKKKKGKEEKEKREKKDSIQWVGVGWP